LTGKRAVLNFSAQCGNEGDDLLAGKSVRSPTSQLGTSYALPKVRAKIDDVQPIGRAGVGPKVFRLGACLRKSVSDPVSGQEDKSVARFGVVDEWH
jgi:hypothetical protein